MEGPIHRSVTISADTPTVWAALTDEGTLARWFGATAEIDLRPGGAIRFRWPDGRERRGVIVGLEVPRRLAFRWRGLDAGTTDVSVVAFELVGTGKATRVTVTETPGELGLEADGSSLAEVSR